MYCASLQCWQETNDDMYCLSCITMCEDIQQRLRDFDLSLDKSEAKSAKCYERLQMKPIVWQKLKYASDTNALAFAVWQQEFQLCTTLDRFEVLLGITLPEFESSAQAILKCFNERKKTHYLYLKDIPSNLVVEDDMAIMMIELPRLIRIQETRIALQNITQTVIHASSIMSQEDIMHIIVNICIHHQKFGTTSLSNTDTLKQLMTTQPTLNDVQNLNLSPSLFDSIKKFFNFA